MEARRKLSQSEKKLLELLISRAAELKLSPNWEDDLLVQAMDDGGMGSLLLLPNGIVDKKRLFGGAVSKYEFIDAVGVDVLVTLNLDQDGELFEIDSWKVDFSPLIRIPDDI
jgi:hypothetical protein